MQLVWELVGLLLWFSRMQLECADALYGLDLGEGVIIFIVIIIVIIIITVIIITNTFIHLLLILHTII